MVRPKSPVKLPSALSDEDLIKQALSEEETVKITDPIVGFLRFYNIESGRYKVRKIILFKLFKLWCKEDITSRFFVSKVDEFIDNNNKFFLINQDAFKIHENTFALIQKKRSLLKSPRFYRHVESFINSNNIKTGSIWVSSPEIYDVYLDWCKKINYKKPLKKTGITKILKLMFPKYKKIRTTIYFKLNRKMYVQKEEKN